MDLNGWWHWLINGNSVNRTSRRRRRLAQFRPRVEQLEDRALLSAFTVTFIADDGPGSLRQAIVDANVHVNDADGPDRIEFHIGDGGPQTIKPLSNLPGITDAVVIDGTTQSGWAPGRPVIELSGTEYNSYYDQVLDFFFRKEGLHIDAAGSTVQGLVFNHYPVDSSLAVILVGAGGCTLEGNFFGTDLAGDDYLGGGYLRIESNNNRIGGGDPGQGNLFSGGVLILGDENTIEGNIVGLNRTADGLFDEGADEGISLIVVAGSHNTLGGSQPGSRNLIRYAWILGDANSVQGNFFGLDMTGEEIATIGQSQSITMLDVFGANNVIGGALPGEGNTFAGPGRAISITGDENIIQGNRIGTNAIGTRFLGGYRTTADGTEYYGTSSGIGVVGNDNLIGGDQPGAGNLISRLPHSGILIEQKNVVEEGTRPEDSSGNIVQGNRLGTVYQDDVLEQSFPYVLSTVMAAGGGAILLASASGNLIGGATPGAGNVVVGQRALSIVGYVPTTLFLESGVEIGWVSGLPSENNVIQGNSFGFDPLNPGLHYPERDDDVLLWGASHNQIGGPLAGEGNYIAGWRAGIEIGGYPDGDLQEWIEFPSSDNVIQGNRINVNFAGTAAIGYTSIHLRGNGVKDTLVGGSSAGEGNLLGGQVESDGSVYTVIQGNLIGTDFTGTQSLHNQPLYVGSISGADMIIGGSTPGSGNVIAYGVTVSGDFADGNHEVVIQGNAIGTDRSGTVDFGNSAPGISIYTSMPDVVIGGEEAGAGNLIAFNGGAGILDRGSFKLTPDSSNFGDGPSRVTILGNSIYGNSGGGIDLAVNTVSGFEIAPNLRPHQSGPTINDAVGHIGPNHYQNYPLVTRAIANPDGTTTVEGVLDSLPETTLTLEFFSNVELDANGFAEGQRWLGRITVTTDSSGHAEFTALLMAAVVPGQWLTATATQPDGSTSEFSPPQAIQNPGLTLALSEETTLPTENVPFSYTITVRNDSPASATAIAVRQLLADFLVLDSFTATQGVYDPATGVWTVDQLPAGETTQLTFIVHAPFGTADKFAHSGAVVEAATGSDGLTTSIGNSSQVTAQVLQSPLRLVAVPASATEGVISRLLVAKIYDDDPNARAEDFLGLVWTGSFRGINPEFEQSGPGEINVLLNVAAAIGEYDFQILVIGNHGAKALVNAHLTVHPVPLSVTTVNSNRIEGPFDAVMAVVSRPDFVVDRETATVLWDDGVVTRATSDRSGENPQHIGYLRTQRDFLTVGKHAFHVTVTDPDGSRAEADGQIVVSDAPLIAGMGQLQEFTLPAPVVASRAVALGPDGNMWFVLQSQQTLLIGRMTREGTISLFESPEPGLAGSFIAAGPAGNLWFSANRYEAASNSYVGKIGRVSPTGQITIFTIPGQGHYAWQMAAGRDGSLWFTDLLAISTLGHLLPDGTITLVPVPTALKGTTQRITTAANGEIWFDERQGNTQQFFRIGVDGSVTAAALSDATLLDYFAGRLRTSDGAVWSVLGNPGFFQPQQIDRFDSAGVDEQFTLATGHSYADSLALGWDGQVWFAELLANRVGRVAMSPTSLNVQEGQSLTGLIAGFSDVNSRGQSGEFTAQLDWGDGTTSTGVVTSAGQYFSTGAPASGKRAAFGIAGDHTYSRAGSYAVTIHVSSVNGSTLTMQIPVQVTDAPLTDTTPLTTLNALAGISTGDIILATFADGNPAAELSDFTSAVKWGGTLFGTPTAEVQFVSRSAAFSTWRVVGTATYTEKGDFRVAVTVTDAGGRSLQTNQTTVSVADAPLTVTARAFAAVAGAPFSGAVTGFIDGNPLHTAANFIATIAWGDGNISAGSVTADGTGGFSVSGNNTFAVAASYAVTVQINCVGGRSATAASTADVASLGLAIQKGQTTDSGFWKNKNGQMLINSFNGGPSATALADWLASTFSNLYGAGAGSHNLTGRTNAQVAAFYINLFSQKGSSLDVQVLDTALDVYATTLSLGGTTAAAYGFKVTAYGLGASSFSVGADGTAFDVPNGTKLNVFQILKAVNRRARNGVLYDGDKSLQKKALEAFEALNRLGAVS